MSRTNTKSHARNILVWALLVPTVTAAISWWVLGSRRDMRALELAADEGYVTPVGPLRLVASMEPLGPDGQIDGVVRDPAAIPDSRIQVDLVQKLQEMNLPVEPLDIRVEDRRVTLEGRVEDFVMRDAIEVTVRSVEGVREVDNRIELIGQ